MNQGLAWERKLIRLGLATARTPKKPRKVRPTGERLFPAWCAAHGLPEPEAEVAGLVPGRKFRVDFLFRIAQVIVEVNGQVWKLGGHSSGSGLLRDYEKLNLLQLEGFVVIQLTPGQLMTPTSLALLQRALK